MPNNGDISQGDVDADGQVDLTDAWLIAVWMSDPSDPALPAGIGEPVGPTASLSPDPSTVTFADDGAWHRFTVEAGEPVSVVANPGTTPRLEITTRSGRGNLCPAVVDDDVAGRDGQAVYLAGCAAGPATVELRRRSDDTVLNTYTFEVTGSPADLVVESVSVGDSSLTPGQSFTLRATVRNQGTGQSEATTLRYYRSTNARITTRDTRVGTDAVGALGASRTSAESIRLTAPSSAGTWYYGACVVSMTGESGESDTRNNCSSAVTVTVGAAPAPDLVVDAPTVSTSSPTAGASFTMSATVRNQGNGQSAATTLRFYRSTNARISTSDTEVGAHTVSGLAASVTSDHSTNLTAPSSAGTWYYGACAESVSGESDTRNNCSSAVTVTVGAAPAPDLVVDAPTVSTSSPTAGASFTLMATVRNQGAARSGSTTLRYYLSTDATVSTSDTEVGTDPVTTLSASRTSSESISLTAPSNAGTYYYGACVESVSDESDTGNNCSPAVTVTVGDAPAPDLVVDAPTVSNSSPTPGASFTLRATVRNQGSGRSSSTTLRYYRSTDATVSTSDTEVGTDLVSSLSASRTSSESISLNAPSSAGTYYYGACVESVRDETDTGNNCSPALTVTVGAAPAPDLVVDAPAVSNSSPTAGASFTLRTTVRNQGSGRSSLTTLRYYRSTDATVSTSDTEVGTDLVSSLSASRTSSESISLRAPSSAGTYYYGACVESVRDETDTRNNCSAAVAVTVGAAPAPDLVVDTPTVSNSSPAPGGSFTLRATVRNQGVARSGSTTLRYFRSTDAAVSTSDTEVGTDPVSGLPPSFTSSESITLTAPSSAGTYYYGACVESVSDETDTGNNCSPAVTVTVTVAPDLVVDAPTVSTTSPTVGASFRLSATVRNQGTSQSAATTLRFYRSDDATISASDTEVGSYDVGGLAVSGTSDHATDLTAPTSAGTWYYYGACVESVSDESNTGNNCSLAVAVYVGAAPAPNLWVVNESVSDSSPTAGQSFTLSATVSNAGNGQSAATTLRFYRSDDATISASDTEVGSHVVGGLAASGTSDHSIDLTAPSSAGTYYYGACVDAVSGESVTGNNCSPGVTVTVGAPDLVVGASVSNDRPTSGASFRLSATVRNQGKGHSAATTLRFYRSTDATISASDTEVGSDAVSGLSASGTSGHSTDLTAPSSEGYYYYGACVGSVSYETDTGNNCSLAVPVYVRAPDLVVDLQSVSDPSPTAGVSFTLSVTVRNQGTSQSAATTLRFYRSTDATISASDTEVGGHDVSGLSAPGTSDHSIELTASSAGTYYYGACVESVSDETDTGNNCSAAWTVHVGAALAPDLVVGTPQAPSYPTAGTSFTLSATVRNQGNGQSAATTLRFYRSTDAAISASDTEVGSIDVGGLSASGTSDHSTDLTAPSSAGTYYYGACVESVSDETDTGNNCSPAVTVTVVAPAPDLVVDAPTVSNSSPTAGVSFTLNATVRNRGNGPSAATTLRFYRSTDRTISASDTEVGSQDVGALSAYGGNRDHSIELTAPSSAGTYYYGACVESVSDESDTGNDCSPAVTVTVVAAPAPDLFVDFLTVSDFTPTIGASFTLRANVYNQGNGPSAATTLRFYRSTDATISASDTEVGSQDVGGLEAIGRSDHSIDLTAPSSAGTYYYGACVKSISNESDTGNNCSSAVTVNVVAAPAPDLVVDAPSVSAGSPAGVSFTLNATVRNQGNGPSAGTTLRFYRSTDGTISGSDTEVGSLDMQGLSASGTSDHSTDLRAPLSVGTYYYGACVESVSEESDTGNNCSPAVTVNVSQTWKLYWTSHEPGKIIQRSNLDGSDVEDLVTVRPGALHPDGFVLPNPDAIALDVSGGKMYWVGPWEHTRRSNLDGSGVEAINTSPESGLIRGIALDVSGGMMYLTDPSSRGINRSNLDGSGFENLVRGNSWTNPLSPYGIALDLSGGKMYWADSSVGIRRSNLDGSGLEDLVVRTGLDSPYGIALDVSGGKMYWTVTRTDKIQRSNLDGSGVEDLIATGLDDPRGIALDLSGGKLYWTDVGTDKIQRSNLDGSGVEDLVTGLSSPIGIALGLVPFVAGTD